jgi:hypothetical protein
VPLPPLKPMTTTRGCTCAASMWSTPRRDWPIGFKGSKGAFATLKADGSITAWGSSGAGGTGAPSGSGYTKIYSTRALERSTSEKRKGSTPITWTSARDR